MSQSTSRIPQIYDLLTSLLAANPSTVELVPGDGSSWLSSAAGQTSYEPFLLVENNLGIPQKVLYLVYLHAVDVFNTARRTSFAQACALDVTEAMIASSSILILANPSHQTALNTRKRLVREDKIDPHKELRFTALLLSSQHCAKHAELWYHRQWLLRIAHTPRLVAVKCNDVSPDAPLDVGLDGLRLELDLVARACELYPRNYFAWTHRLTCTRSFFRNVPTTPEEQDKIATTLHREIAEMKRWIECHISDYSAVHYLTTLVQCLHRADDSFLRGVVKDAKLFEHASSLVRTYPDHESLWLYARISFFESDPYEEESMKRFLEGVLSMSRQLNDNSQSDATPQSLRHAQHYLSRMGKASSSSQRHA